MAALKPFSSIPGPRSLPFIGALYKYVPVVGSYSLKRLHRCGLLKYQEFGPLVRERLIKGVELLHVYDPEDIGEVFANDGTFPFRRSHIALQKYRLDRPHMYTCGGLIPTNGEEWWRCRREAQKVMTRLQCVRSHLPIVNEICTDFVKLIENETRKNEIDDFLIFLKKLFLEITMQTTVDYRFSSLDSHTPFDSEAAQLLNAAENSTKGILSTDNGIPFWKWFNTPLYRKLTEGQDTIYRIALKYVEKKVAELEAKSKETELPKSSIDSSRDELSILEYFLLNSNLSKKDILTLVCDALLAGTDTSSYTSSFMLYHLATNQDKQEKLANEATELLSESGGKVTDPVLSKARYMKAVVKESFRLNPVSIGVGRIATKDFALRGYHIPKETIIVTQNQVACRLEKYFPEPNKFIPERWLEKDSRPKSPYLLLPFGHGPRACIGRRMAEQSIFCFLLLMFKDFKIRWKGAKELDCYSNLINEPDSKLHFEFIKRA